VSEDLSWVFFHNKSRKKERIELKIDFVLASAAGGGAADVL